jgi:dipeptidyl aminopeptidase/acylaminoacyl peptidase
MKWLQNDEAVFIYDRYGVWKVDVNGKQNPVNFIGGRDKKIEYRYVQTDAEEKFIKKGQHLAFLTFSEINKKAGLWQGLYTGENTMNTVLLPVHSDDGHYISQVVKSKNTNSYLFAMESFNEPTDLYYWHQTDEGPDGNKLSSINPQQSNYLWGTSELFKWKSFNGKEATGLVYKPEDFDPTKKYPMIVYFYEKLSDGLYDYKEPAPIRSAINVPFFVSRGYIIFMPDITYKIGYPGKSAYDYIISGARALVKKGWVDSTNMALQGHSWGGYQAAQVATMTKLFKAVWAGAPVANMTSAYGGIRWESGVARQFQYEKTQSRIGGTLWEKLPLYLENSPLFHLNKVTAPMVIMANDADGAVPWYQGIELYTGLRRLGKKVWMFNYNGQGHGLTQRQDMRDYQIRMQQFFDWILKGDKPAKWITEGVPAVKKGKEWGLEFE